MTSELVLTYTSIPPTRKTRKSLTLKAKLDIIKRVENGERKSEVAATLGLAKSTVRTIIQNAEAIQDSARRCTPLTSKKITVTRNHVLENMERMLCSWINELNKNQMPVTQRVIMERARIMYKELSENEEDNSINANIPFLASRGWFDRFRKRVNLQNVKMMNQGYNVPMVDLPMEIAPEYTAIKTEIDVEEYQTVEDINTPSTSVVEDTFIITEVAEQYHHNEDSENLNTYSDSITTNQQQVLTISNPRHLNNSLYHNGVYSKDDGSGTSSFEESKNIAASDLHQAFTLLDEVIEIFHNIDPIRDRSKKVAKSLHESIACYIEMYQKSQTENRQQYLMNEQSSYPIMSVNLANSSAEDTSTSEDSISDIKDDDIFDSE